MYPSSFIDFWHLYQNTKLTTTFSMRFQIPDAVWVLICLRSCPAEHYGELAIACLGLLGMVIYTTRNREKEVGIRRVMGAKVVQVIMTISKEFFALLLISVSIGLPLAYMAGRQFLQQYAYRIPFTVGILAGSAATLLLLGGLTIGWQTYRTAITNPARSLRTE